MHFIPLIRGYFWCNLFLEGSAEILTKISGFFGRFGDTKIPFRNQLTFGNQKLLLKSIYLQISNLLVMDCIKCFVVLILNKKL